MKNLLFLLIPASLFLASCNNIAKYQEMVTGLTTDWDNATTSVTAAIEKLNQEKTNFQNMLQSTTLSEEDKAGKDEAYVNAFAQANAQLQGQSASFETLTSEVTAFTTQWQENSATLETLKSAIAEGKLPEGADATINSLKEMVTTATANAEGWNGKIDEVAAKCMEIYSSLKASMAPAESAQ